MKREEKKRKKRRAGGMCANVMCDCLCGIQMAKAKAEQDGGCGQATDWLTGGAEEREREERREEAHHFSSLQRFSPSLQSPL